MIASQALAAPYTCPRADLLFGWAHTALSVLSHQINDLFSSPHDRLAGGILLRIL